MKANGNGKPQEDGDGRAAREGGASATATSRREFLKVLGITGAGTAAAGCGAPDVGDKLLPHLVQETGREPGENVRYATALASAGPEPVPLHALTRDGRVLNLELNPDFPADARGVTALTLSAVQDLYDPDRIPGPRRGPLPADAGRSAEPELAREGGARAARTADGAPDFRGGEPLGWEEALGAAGQAIAGDGVVLLTGAVPGTSDRFYDEWADAVGAERIRYEALDHAPLREAHRIAFGRAEIPAYALDRADRVVSFGADFLDSWLAPAELSARFREAQAVDEGRYAELVFVGPRLSLTGTNADEWLPARPGTEALVALGAARVVAGERGSAVEPEIAALLRPYSPENVADRTGVGAERIRALGEGLAAADAPAALPPGISGQAETATDAHLAVALLNYVSGAVGSTVLFGAGPARGEPATYGEMRELAGRMEAGEVRTLIVAGPNPAHTLPAASGFEAALEQVETVISLNSHPDETTVAADLVLPSHHELEAWGDVLVRPGVRALRQPVTRPVWDTRQAEQILLDAAAAAGLGVELGADDFYGYLRGRWRELYRESGGAVAGQGYAGDAPAAVGEGEGGSRLAGSFEDWWRRTLQVGVYVGREPGPEAVRPTAGLTSHRFPVFSPSEGMSLVTWPTGHLYDGRGANRAWLQELPDSVTRVVWSSWAELHPETAAPLGLETGDVLEISSEAGTVSAPVYVYEGIRPDAVGLPLGQGHSAYGRLARDRGTDPLELLPDRTDRRSGALAYSGLPVEVTATGETEQLVVTQGSDTDEGRQIAEIMGADAALHAADEKRVDLGELVEEAYDSDPQSPYRWGMSIDLNACTGCGACATACYAENNLPVVGEDRCAEGREMSWLRVARYFEETAEDRDVGGFRTVHEPMLCQHCGDAPCEPVCPVYATYHNPEGLNVQVYNRCVGTRYCSNNCPYKVRRFNWFTYEWPYPLNLQLNPDVTVRQKGVMEKCTFCVQRINRAKIEAKEKGRLVRDGEVTTACQAACPTQAITFGNLKDPSSEVSRAARNERSYHVLEDLNTRPAISYLKDVTSADLPADGEHGGGHDGGGNGQGRGGERAGSGSSGGQRGGSGTGGGQPGGSGTGADQHGEAGPGDRGHG